MKIKIAIAAVCLSALAVSQEARIIIVEKEDATTLKTAYKDYKEAQKRWEKTKTEVAKKYTMEDGKTIKGWEQVQFSADFRAIVPASSQYASVGPYWNGWYGNAIPAVGTTTGALTSGTMSFNANGRVTAGSDVDVRDNLVTSDDVLLNLKTKAR